MNFVDDAYPEINSIRMAPGERYSKLRLRFHVAFCDFNRHLPASTMAGPHNPAYRPGWAIWNGWDLMCQLAGNLAKELEGVSEEKRVLLEENDRLYREIERLNER